MERVDKEITMNLGYTNVYGVITVDTFGRSDAESMYIAQTVVSHLPKPPYIPELSNGIKYYLNLDENFPNTSNCDEFFRRSNLGIKKHGTYYFTHNSLVTITINGLINYLPFAEGIKEITKILSRLSSRLLVLECIVCIEGENPRNEQRKQFIFNNPEWITDRDDSNWVREKIFKETE